MMKYKLKAYSIWEQGPREKQEDSIYPKHGEIIDADRLFILCDGMGGHSAGEVASSTVCSAMSTYILSHTSEPENDFSDDDFTTALNAAYNALDKKDNGAAKKMGTTLAFLKLHNAGCTIAHIGDSRVYHIRPGENAANTEILFQTEDHSLINDLVKIGELTREEAKFSKQKNVITRAMQPCMERRSKADIYHSQDIKLGDYFILCSDGILEQMEDENLKFIFSAKGGDILNKIDILIKATAHNHDNHTAILVNITAIEGIATNVDSSHNPELLMAQISDTTNIHNAMSHDMNGNNNCNDSDRHSVRDIKQLTNMSIKAVSYFIFCCLLAFGGYYLYNKNRKNIEEPTPSHNTGSTKANSQQAQHTNTITPQSPDSGQSESYDKDNSTSDFVA